MGKGFNGKRKSNMVKQVLLNTRFSAPSKKTEDTCLVISVPNWTKIGLKGLDEEMNESIRAVRMAFFILDNCKL